MKRRLKAPSPALVISLLALFVALGGTTYAATNLPKNSVGTKQLKKNAVTAAKVENRAVTASKINTRGLTVPNALHATSATSATNATHATSATNATIATNAADATHATSATNATNATHAASATSATTATSAATADSLAGVQIVAGPTRFAAPLAQDDEVVVCPAGMVTIGGNAQSQLVTPRISLGHVPIVDSNGGTNNAVHVYVNNERGISTPWNAYAICINGSETGSSG